MQRKPLYTTGNSGIHFFFKFWTQSKIRIYTIWDFFIIFCDRFFGSKECSDLNIRYPVTRKTGDRPQMVFYWELLLNYWLFFWVIYYENEKVKKCFKSLLMTWNFSTSLRWVRCVCCRHFNRFRQFSSELKNFGISEFTHFRSYCSVEP